MGLCTAWAKTGLTGVACAVAVATGTETWVRAWVSSNARMIPGDSWYLELLPRRYSFWDSNRKRLVGSRNLNKKRGGVSRCSYSAKWPLCSVKRASLTCMFIVCPGPLSIGQVT
jgi:hypothetical protein